MTARFFGCEIHPVYATFAIVEHAEYVSRYLIRSSFADDEDAVGSSVDIRHRSPAPVGTIVTLEATLRSIDGPRVTCDVRIHASGRDIAEVVTVQHVMEKARVRGMYGER